MQEIFLLMTCLLLLDAKCVKVPNVQFQVRFLLKYGLLVLLKSSALLQSRSSLRQHVVTDTMRQQDFYKLLSPDLPSLVNGPDISAIKLCNRYKMLVTVLLHVVIRSIKIDHKY